ADRPRLIPGDREALPSGDPGGLAVGVDDTVRTDREAGARREDRTPLAQWGDTADAVASQHLEDEAGVPGHPRLQGDHVALLHDVADQMEHRTAPGDGDTATQTGRRRLSPGHRQGPG